MAEITNNKNNGNSDSWEANSFPISFFFQIYLGYV